MAVSYTPSLRLPIIPPGDPSARNSWGTILNSAMVCIEAAITGNATIDLTGLTTYTLTVADDATDQARLGFYNFIGTPTAACTVTMPAVAKTGWAQNSTTGGFDVILTTGSGATVTISPGQTVSYQTFGTDVFVPSLSNPVPGAGRIVGEMIPFGGYSPPSLWYLCYGQSFSRTTFSALFSALSFTTTGNVTSGSNQITNVAARPPNAGFAGVAVEGAGIPNGTTAISSAGTGPYTWTLSKNATATSTGASIRILPHGQGDGSTTFNLPDFRARFPAGNDYMGGTPSGRITNASGIAFAQLGASGGDQLSQKHNHTISDPGHAHGVSDPGHAHQMLDPGHGHGQNLHSHGISDPGHAHGVSDPGHNHGIGVAAPPGSANIITYGAGGSNPGNLGSSANTTGIGIFAATTGISVNGAFAQINNAFTGVSMKAAFTGIGINSATTGISVNNAGSGQSQNIPPVLFANWIIYAGA